MTKLPIGAGDDPRLDDVCARVEADAALRAARATLVRAVLALYAADQATLAAPAARRHFYAALWTNAERATMDAAAAYLAAGGSEETL